MPRMDEVMKTAARIRSGKNEGERVKSNLLRLIDLTTKARRETLARPKRRYCLLMKKYSEVMGRKNRGRRRAVKKGMNLRTVEETFSKNCCMEQF